MRSRDFKAQKGGGLAIVAVKQEVGKGQARDISEVDPGGSDGGASGVLVEQPKPKGLIKSVEASGVVAAEGGGWKARADHAPDENIVEWEARLPDWKARILEDGGKLVKRGSIIGGSNLCDESWQVLQAVRV